MTIDVAPQVVGAFVSGTAWNAAYLSMLDAAGLGSSAATGQGFELASGASQLTTMVPWNNVNQISIAFSEPVTASQSSLTLYNSSNTAITPSGFSYNSAAEPARPAAPGLEPSAALALVLDSLTQASPRIQWLPAGDVAEADAPRSPPVASAVGLSSQPGRLLLDEDFSAIAAAGDDDLTAFDLALAAAPVRHASGPSTQAGI